LLHGRPGAVYHVGGGTELTNIDLTHRLLEAMGAGPDRIERVPDRRAHDRRYSLDSSRSKAELGYVPRTSFDSGLAETIQWYRDNHSWWEPLKVASER
jgi:dTDP-glucose 4,6-dehydratase